MFNFLASITEQISEKVSEFLNKYIDLAVDGLKSLPWWLQIIILLVLVVVVVMGIIRLIVKSWKLLLVLAILLAIGVAVYFIFIRNRQASGAFDAINLLNTLSSTIFL